MSENNLSFYQILGIKTNATEAEIKKAYRELARMYDPDRFEMNSKCGHGLCGLKKGGQKEIFFCSSFCRSKYKEYEEKFQLITEAYEVLVDPKKRKAYGAEEDAKDKGDRKKDKDKNDNQKSPKLYSNYSWDNKKTTFEVPRDSNVNWDEYWKIWQEDSDRVRRTRDLNKKEGGEKWLKGIQNEAIERITSMLSKEKVSDQQLNIRLRVSDWKEEIRKGTGEMTVNDQELKVRAVIGSLSREFTCAGCEQTRNDLTWTWREGEKKYCSYECRFPDKTHPWKRNKDNSPQKPSNREKELEEEVKRLKTELAKSKEFNVKEIVAWMKKEGVSKFFLSPDGKLIVEYNNQKTEVLREESSPKWSQEIKNYFQKNPQAREVSLQRLEALENSQENNSVGGENDSNSWILSVVIIGIIGLIVVGVLVLLRKKKQSKEI